MPLHLLRDPTPAGTSPDPDLDRLIAFGLAKTEAGAQSVLLIIATGATVHAVAVYFISNAPSSGGAPSGMSHRRLSPIAWSMRMPPTCAMPARSISTNGA